MPSAEAKNRVAPQLRLAQATLHPQMRTQPTPFASVCCSDSFFSIPFVKTPEPYQKLVDEAEKRAAGRAIAPDP